MVPMVPLEEFSLDSNQKWSNLEPDKFGGSKIFGMETVKNVERIKSELVDINSNKSVTSQI